MDMRKLLEDALLFARHQDDCNGRHISEFACSCGYQDWWGRANDALAILAARSSQGRY